MTRPRASMSSLTIPMTGSLKANIDTDAAAEISQPLHAFAFEHVGRQPRLHDGLELFERGRVRRLGKVHHEHGFPIDRLTREFILAELTDDPAERRSKLIDRLQPARSASGDGFHIVRVASDERAELVARSRVRDDVSRELLLSRNVDRAQIDDSTCEDSRLGNARVPVRARQPPSIGPADLAPSEVFRLEAGLFGEAREHPRTNLFLIVERKRRVGPAFTHERPVRAALLRHQPTDAEQRREDARRFGRRPLAHAADAVSNDTVSGVSGNSPPSSLSARTRSASTCTRASACSRVSP